MSPPTCPPPLPPHLLPPLLKRRRGRQPRPSLLSPPIKTAVQIFAAAVGQPRVIEPAGFRDFRGWLAYIASPAAYPLWNPLVRAVLSECDTDTRIIHKLKPDLVREIVKAVVIPKEGESSKLVSTNCGRQCARPGSGVTLMTILDRVFANWRQYRDGLAVPTQVPISHQTSHSYYAPSPVQQLGLVSTRVEQHAPETTTVPNPSEHELPSVQKLFAEQTLRTPARPDRSLTASVSWPGERATSSAAQRARAGARALPSFRELEDSLLAPPHMGKKRSRG